MTKTRLKNTLIIFLIAIIAISTISIVSAADITISPTTPGGVKQAIETANPGDTILLENGVYKGIDNTEIQINKNINIKGKGSNVVMDGQGKNRAFDIQGVKVSVTKIKFTNGYNKYQGGTINLIGGSLTVSSCTFTNSKAKEFGGGSIYAENKCTVSVSKSTFTNNQGTYGGAIRMLSDGNSLTISSCTFKNNQAGGYGGAIHSADKGTVTDSTFTNNKAINGGGGAIYGVRTVSKSTFKNNQATKDYGGAISSVGTVSKSTFTNNKAIKSNGGAIAYVGTVSGSTFTNNKAKDYGGAIYNRNSLKITDSKFNKNIAGKEYYAITSLKKVTKKNVKITPKDGTKVKK